MIIKQVTVIIENKDGKLKEVMDILAAENINVEALSMADTVTRIIVEEPEETMALLVDNGYEVHLQDVVSVMIPSKAGALADLLVSIAEESINIEYMYAYASGAGMIMSPSNLRRTEELVSAWDSSPFK